MKGGQDLGTWKGRGKWRAKLERDDLWSRKSQSLKEKDG